MAKKDAEEFYRRLTEEPDLQKAVDEATSGLYELAQERGFKFSPEDLNQLLRDRWKDQMCDRLHKLCKGEPVPEEEIEPDTCYSEPPGF